MIAPRKRKTPSWMTQAAELGVAVPQVVAHRLTRMALAGPLPSARDRKEFERMVAEKNAAFGESWNAMARQCLRANQGLAASFLQALWSPPALRSGRKSGAVATQVQHAALGILGKGLAPVHRKAMANARRLAKTKLR